jgi:CheY-like chemotaxis protein
MDSGRMTAAGCTGQGVLVVEDDEAVRDALQSVLEDEGFRVTAAENGLRALEILRSGQLPCLMLLDLMMPLMSGFELNEHVRQDPAMSELPVIIITAAHAPVLPRATRVIRKPIRITELLAVVREYCGQTASRP